MASLPFDVAAVAPLVCVIIENRTSTTAQLYLKLEAVADSSGRFALAVRKTDAFGSSVMQQSGSFTLPAGASGNYGHVALSVSADGRLVADGRVTLGDTTIACRVERRDDL